MQLNGQNGGVSIVNIEEILLFNVVLRTGFDDACYEHISLVKSGEDNH